MSKYNSVQLQRHCKIMKDDEKTNKSPTRQIKTLQPKRHQKVKGI